MRAFYFSAILLSGLLVLAGCSSKGKPAPEQAAATPIVTTETVAAPTPINEPAPVRLELTTQNSNMTTGSPENILFFNYDSADIRAEYQDDIEMHAKQLVANPRMRIILEGHADERGTREYNMALGEQRAYSVKKMLIARGVAKDQIQTVSFGEERPMAEGHNENAWKENRRAVFTDSSN